jgi:3-hydroxybutyrate dehydrogenase
VVVDLDGDGDAAARTADRVGGSAVVVDLGDPAAVAELCGPGGPVATADVVVNNAGLQHVSTIEDFARKRFSLILRVMLDAPFQLVRVALPRMYARGWGGSSASRRCTACARAPTGPPTSPPSTGSSTGASREQVAA